MRACYLLVFVEILTSFDVDICAIGYDPTEYAAQGGRHLLISAARLFRGVVVTPRWLSAWERGFNLLDVGPVYRGC